MALVVKDRVQETSTTTGTGTLTLNGASTGFQTFSSSIGNGNTTYYTIALNSSWEVGIGTVGAGTLSRDTVLESSNAGSLVNFGSGTKSVFCTYPAEKSVDTETAQTLTNKTISGASNTLSDIANSSLTNSAITINGTSTSLGGSISVGTVTSVTGTSPVASSGGATPAISLASGYGDTQNPYASKTANFVLAAPNGSSGAPTFRAIVSADIPTLNQNTTGSAATFTSTTQNSQFNSIGVGTAGSGTAGEIRATNNVTAYYSDDRFKTNLGNIPNALDKVKTLNGFYYEANELAQSYGYDKKLEVGVSAQQVQAILPEVVAPAPIDEKYLTVRYERLVPLLIEAIKELKAEVDTLKGK